MEETVSKVKHSSARIKNSLLALYRGTEYFGLARTFRTAWGETICIMHVSAVIFMKSCVS